ncbi:MAG: hypothetical protein ACD_63C00173G0003 [uncultured bacterium]|nr:MAG: hypothetical protein ACD_63C00173G0003 [uncultured bacterium]
MKDELKKLEGEALEAIESSETSDVLEELRVKYLGRKGEVSLLLRKIKGLSDEEKRVVGKIGNEIRSTLEAAFEDKKVGINSEKYKNIAEEEWVDVTESGIPPEVGSLHPITQMRNEVEDVVTRMGFEIVDTPEVDSDYYCFESLNLPKGHPARSAWDTFYLENGMIPRVHTSTMQVRVMEKRKPPLCVINIGRCFRNERTDASHDHTFYQIEGFVADKKITISNLSATLKFFFELIYKKKVEIRLRPGFFPFVEPAMELELRCVICGGEGCSVCKHSGWLEMLGCGMIHPKVFEFAGYKKGEYTGFAFGMGLDRIVMMKHGIKDIRNFHSGDLRFLKQF